MNAESLAVICLLLQYIKDKVSQFKELEDNIRAKKSQTRSWYPKGNWVAQTCINSVNKLNINIFLFT